MYVDNIKILGLNRNVFVILKLIPEIHVPFMEPGARRLRRTAVRGSCAVDRADDDDCGVVGVAVRAASLIGDK